MSRPQGFRAFVLAVAAGALALTSALAFGAGLRRAAARDSHQQPTAEKLFEPAAPSTPQLVARGRSLYLDSCAHCHGAEARGDEGPDLHDVQVSDRYIANIVQHGIPHEMPSFAKKHNAADIEALTAYVRSLH
ncbi:MAG TPA: cytochrome c [Candidatus Didemnitutus sp.]|nr:cytochrome c [Candidatus Didemnitutus sp.]